MAPTQSSKIPERPSSKSPQPGVRPSATAPADSRANASDAQHPSPSASPPPRERAESNPQRHHHTLAGAAHAVMFTQNWKPGIARAQSWTPEDRKRSVQMMGLMEEEIPEGYSQYSER